MLGNTWCAIQEIIFMFGFIFYNHAILIGKFYCDDIANKYAYGVSVLISWFATLLTCFISITYLEDIYLNHWFLFWFIKITMSSSLTRIEIFIINFLAKIIEKRFEND